MYGCALHVFARTQHGLLLQGRSGHAAASAEDCVANFSLLVEGRVSLSLSVEGRRNLGLASVGLASLGLPSAMALFPACDVTSRGCSANALGFSCDGLRLAVGYEDGSLEVCSRGQRTASLEQPVGDVPITSVCFSSQGPWLAVGFGRASDGDQDGQVAIFEVSGSPLRKVRCFEPCRKHTRVADVHFSCKGHLAVAGGHVNDGYCAVYRPVLDALSGWVVTRQSPSSHRVKMPSDSPVSVAPAGPCLLQSQSLIGSGKRVDSVEWPGEGGGGQQQSELSCFLPLCKWQNSVCFSPDASWLASAGGNKQVLVFDMKKDSLERNCTLERTANIRAICFSGTGQWLASGGSDEMVSLYHTSTWDLVHEIRCDGAVRTVSFSWDSLHLAAGGRSGILNVFDTATASLQHEFAYDSCLINATCWCPADGASGLVACTSKGERNVVLDPRACPHECELEEPIGAACFSRDGLLAVGGSKLLKVYDINGRCPLWEYTCASIVRAMCFSPDGRWLAVGFDDRQLSVYPARDCGPVATFPVPVSEWITCVCFATHGSDSHSVCLAIADGGGGQAMRTEAVFGELTR